MITQQAKDYCTKHLAELAEEVLNSDKGYARDAKIHRLAQLIKGRDAIVIAECLVEQEALRVVME